MMKFSQCIFFLKVLLQNGPTAMHYMHNWSILYTLDRRKYYDYWLFLPRNHLFFSRFLKSELYKDSLVAEMSGKTLPFDAGIDGEPLLQIGENTLGRSKSQESTSSAGSTSARRRSILPWGKS